jgi:hypothetical protein
MELDEVRLSSPANLMTEPLDRTHRMHALPVPTHPDLLVRPTLSTDAARHICGVGAVLEVVPAAGHQSGLKCAGPLLVGLGQSPHLVGGQAKVTEHRSERLATVDRVEELLPQLYGESLLRPASEARPGGVVLGFTASVAIAAFRPAGQGAVGDLRAAAATLGIGLVADLMQLLESPRRLRDPAERAPASDDRRRHIAHGSRLANRGDHLLSIHQTNASGSPLAFA